MNDEEEAEVSTALYNHILDKVIAEKIPPRAACAALTAALISCAQAADVSPEAVVANVATAVARASGGQCEVYALKAPEKDVPPS